MDGMGGLFEPGWMGLEDGPRPSWKTYFRLNVPHSVGADRIRPLPCTGPACSLTAFPMSIKTESPLSVDSGPLYKIRHRPTLPPVTAIPSALAGLTSLFGMGRGGHRRYRHLNTFLYMAPWGPLHIDMLLEEKIRKRERTTGLSALESFGLLVPLGFGLSTFTPVAYRRRNLRRPL